jgi:multiple sugar transport system substrate-binding protein
MAKSSPVSRREFLVGAGAAAGALGLASGSLGAALARKASAPAAISFTTWASTAEEQAFKRVIANFHAKYKTVRVTLNVVPYGQMLQGINARLQAGNAPDVFRVTFTSLGLYSSKGALLDLSKYVDKAFVQQFQAAYWAGTTYNGKPYGVPHQTDTTALLYNKAMLAKAGIKHVPDTLKSAWTWEEFLSVAEKVQKTLPSGEYAFMYDWAQTGAFRWLTWLFEAGGNLLTSDLKHPAINSAAGVSALEFTQSFFKKGLVPKNTSTGSAVYPDTLFPAKKVAMAFAGDFLLPGDIATAAKFPFGATFQPRDKHASSELGGNGIVGTQQTKNPEATAEFLKFLVSKQSQALFCEMTNELPTRKDLAHAKLNYAVRPDLMKFFSVQATTLTPFQVRQVTVPAFGAINTVLQQQLDSAFVGGQSAKTTLSNLSSQVATALSKS